MCKIEENANIKESGGVLGSLLLCTAWHKAEYSFY